MSLGVKMAENIPFHELERQFLPSLEDYYRHPARFYVKPFQIFGNLYYIGDKKVCSHLLDTGDGLIVFDSGYSHAVHLLLHSIWSLGFDPRTIKYVIHSHGHFDHFGGGEALRDLFGCKLLLSKADAARMKANPRSALMEYSPTPYAGIPSHDHELEDDEVIALGNASIRCALAPGHTEGTMAFFFDALDGPQSLRVGYFGGVGFLSLYKAFLEKYSLPSDMQEQLKATLTKLRREQVDITIGNHPSHNGTLEKRGYMLEHPKENPFVDPTVWPELLDAIGNRLDDFQNKGY